jgi:hypothetical protein
MLRRLVMIDNLKNFILTKPPTVLFLACLFSFIVVLSSYMEYLKTTTEGVANLDELDWNTFREKLARLDFCIQLPATATNTSTSAVKPNNRDIRK